MTRLSLSSLMLSSISVATFRLQRASTQGGVFQGITSSSCFSHSHSDVMTLDDVSTDISRL